MKTSEFMEIKNKTVCFSSGCNFTFKEIQKWSKIFHCQTGEIKKTMEIEKNGERLMKSGFADVPSIICFVEDVFTWGGRTANVYVRPRLYKEQTKKEIAKVVAETAYFLQKKDVESGYNKLVSLHGLGMSYGSKILRMMAPSRAVVYDSVLAENLLYRCNLKHYLIFCRDCQAVAEALTKSNFKNPPRESVKWFAADVEGAIYRKITSDNVE